MAAAGAAAVTRTPARWAAPVALAAARRRGSTARARTRRRRCSCSWCADSMPAVVLLHAASGAGADAELRRLLADASVTKVVFGPPEREQLGAIASAVDAQAPRRRPRPPTAARPRRPPRCRRRCAASRPSRASGSRGARSRSTRGCSARSARSAGAPPLARRRPPRGSRGDAARSPPPTRGPRCRSVSVLCASRARREFRNLISCERLAHARASCTTRPSPQRPRPRSRRRPARPPPSGRGRDAGLEEASASGRTAKAPRSERSRSSTPRRPPHVAGALPVARAEGVAAAPRPRLACQRSHGSDARGWRPAAQLPEQREPATAGC